MKYEKDPLSIKDQLSVLQNESQLIIKDPDRAKKYLESIGYYRLSGYMFHLQVKDGSHIFNEGTDFNEIIRYYKFDQQLRIIFLTYLERIEVRLRAALTNQFSINHGFFWYQEKDLYADLKTYDIVCSEIEKNFIKAKERFIKSYIKTYTSENSLPSNMALQTLTFGSLSRLYKGLKNNTEKMAIAKSFELPSPILSSWFIYLNNVRNVCAHFGRLWNRRLTADQPKIPTRQKYKFNGELPKKFNNSLYGMISLIDRLLASFNPQNQFLDRVLDLIDEYSDIIDVKFMGFADDWEENPPW